MLVGGIIIAIGYFTLAVARVDTFYLGLILVGLGTGLLKPNVSAIAGQLYPEGGERRDAGFTFFYVRPASSTRSANFASARWD